MRTLTYSNLDFYWAGYITPQRYDQVAARFTGKLTPLRSGSTKMALTQDDGASLIINGEEIIDKFPNYWWGTAYATYNLHAFETYDIEVKFVDYGNAAVIKLGWDIGNGPVTIPSENFSKSNDVGASPIQVSVNCFGSYQQVPSTTNQCQMCGDGVKNGTETCDDANTEKGDGCSQDCTYVESGWKCDQGSPTVCERDYDSVPLSSSDRILQASMLFITFLAFSFNIAGGFMSLSSANSALASLNQLQLLILLVLLEVPLPLKVVNYLRSMSFTLINFSIDWSSIEGIRIIVDQIDHSQDREDFVVIGIESGSTLLNLASLLLLICLIVLSHSLFYGCIRWKEDSQASWMRRIRKIYTMLTFEIYFVTYFEGFMTLSLCCLSELKWWNSDSNNSERVSFYFCVVFSLISLVLILLVLTAWTCTKPNKKSKFLRKELFKGLKYRKMARLHPFIFLLRRATLCAIIIYLRWVPRPTFLTFYSAVNLIYFIEFLAVRPFQKISPNIMELINEFFHVGFTVFLVFHNKEEHWDASKELGYFWAMISNNIVNTFISFVVFVHSTCKKRWAKRRKKVSVQGPSPEFIRYKQNRAKIMPRRNQDAQEIANDLRQYKFRSRVSKSKIAPSTLSKQSAQYLRQKFSLNKPSRNFMR
ncbi:unnamed protein product [Moneuplotes crassus]|uniref:PA14 domain-containing protein n=1 Tax=Euplotes crassus TaxID=5936 RepID=A0AAD2D6T2_EUPCR|nr:unnamed protein product [Moneuplotes crassus]